MTQEETWRNDGAGKLSISASARRREMEKGKREGKGKCPLSWGPSEQADSAMEICKPPQAWWGRGGGDPGK